MFNNWKIESFLYDVTYNFFLVVNYVISSNKLNPVTSFLHCMVFIIYSENDSSQLHSQQAKLGIIMQYNSQTTFCLGSFL